LAWLAQSSRMASNWLLKEDIIPAMADKPDL